MPQNEPLVTALGVDTADRGPSRSVEFSDVPNPPPLKQTALRTRPLRRLECYPEHRAFARDGARDAPEASDARHGGSRTCGCELRPASNAVDHGLVSKCRERQNDTERHFASSSSQALPLNLALALVTYRTGNAAQYRRENIEQKSENMRRIERCPRPGAHEKWKR